METGSPLARAIADEIQDMQKRAGLSNRAFAEKLGVTHPYLGDRYAYKQDFSLDDIARVAELFNTDPVEIMLRARARDAWTLAANTERMSPDEEAQAVADAE